MLLNFWIPSILMGLGIAIDVAVATVSRFRDETMTFRSWTLPVAIAHILLPAIGYYTWWGLGETFSLLVLPLGILAFAMISIFLYEAFCEWIGVVPRISLDPIVSVMFSRLTARHKGKAVMILAVSLDALWSGPAKSAQATSGEWNGTLVFLSFFVAGVVVAIVAEISLLFASWLRRIRTENISVLAVWLVVGKYSEASILLGFGILALWNAFGIWIGNGSLFYCIVAAALTLSFAWIIYWRSLVSVQLSEISEAENNRCT